MREFQVEVEDLFRIPLFRLLMVVTLTFPVRLEFVVVWKGLEVEVNACFMGEYVPTELSGD